MKPRGGWIDGEIGYVRMKRSVVMVDVADFPLVAAQNWSLVAGRYAQRIEIRDGVKTRYYLHRVITEAGPGQVVDHINGNALDNRRSNLRLTDARGNSRNSGRKGRNQSSRFKGVTWYRNYGNWRAQITVDYKLKALGYFDSEVDAARAYNAAARKYFGAFARPNDVEEQCV